MQTVIWRYPALERVLLGVDAGAALADEADRLGRRRVFILTSKSVARSDFLKSLTAKLGDRHAGTFDGVAAHGPLENIFDASAAARRAGADLIAAVGGGTAIDVSKVVVICLRHGLTDIEGLAAFRGIAAERDPTRRPADESDWVRMIAVPTTLSAAEFTWWGGGLDTLRQVKEPYTQALSMARTVILDPAASLSAPLPLFLATGMKAVDHAAERLTSVRRDALSDARCIHSLKMLAHGLPWAHAEPENLEARLECQTAMAVGMASPSTGVGVGASHAVGHALGGHNGVQHGLTSCVMLPSVMRWNLGLNADRQALISEAMGRAGDAAADVIQDLVISLGLPHRLRDVGVARSDFPIIAQKVLGDHSISGNVRQPQGPEDLVELLEMAW